jgi:hypothetical protein
MTFERYLMEQWQKEVTGTEEDVLDDDISDAFDRWVEIMPNDDVMKHAEAFGHAMYLAGMDKASAIIESIKTDTGDK